MSPYRIVVLLHLVAGSVALVTYWGAALARKGSLLHRRIGQTYLVAMLGVLLTGAGLSAAFWLRGQPALATFLGYLVVITATACWQGWQAVRTRRTPSAYYGVVFEALAWVNLASGLAVFVIGLELSSALLSGFSWVGVLGGAAMLWRRRRPATANPRWWMQEHYSAMLGCGVATHIAFLALGLTRLLESAGLAMPALLPWFGPLAVMLLARVGLDRKYGRPVAGAPRGRASALRPTESGLSTEVSTATTPLR